MLSAAESPAGLLTSPSRSQITSDQPDLHSGMQGGVVSEPLVDMVRLLASLTDADGRVSLWKPDITRRSRNRSCLNSSTLQVRIPGFLDDVRRLGAEENALFDDVVQRCRSYVPLVKLKSFSGFFTDSPFRTAVRRTPTSSASTRTKRIRSAP